MKNVLGHLNEEFKPDFDYLFYDTVFIDNLKNLALNRTDYTFNIPALDNEPWINEIYSKQYRSEYSCCYERDSADPAFARLIKEKKFHILESLLFSPNYYTSIHAMEALAYSSYKKLIQLSPESLHRMDYIKNASFHVMSQGAPDVRYRKEGYKDLHSLIEHVIKKYRIELSN
jgi:hypothetical protein